LEEPYIDQAGTGFFQYPDPYCDANNNGRWDGLYNSGGVATLLTWVHDDIWARALAISDGAHTVLIESITSQGLMIEDIQRMRVGEFSPPDVRARLSTTFLTTDSNPMVTIGPTADGTPEATNTKALVLQLRNAQTGANIETLFNWAAHNQQTGHAPTDSVAPDP